MKKIALVILLASCQVSTTSEALKKAEKINDEQISIYWQNEEALAKKDTALSREFDEKSMDLDDEMDKIYPSLPDSTKDRLSAKFQLETEIKKRLQKTSEKFH